MAEPETSELVTGRTVVLVMGNELIAGHDLLAPAIRGRGLRVAAITGQAPTTTVQEFAVSADAHLAIADPFDHEQVAAAAGELAGGVPAAVLSWHDLVMVGAARAAESLGIARQDWRALARARNKYATRRALRKAGLPCPGFALFGVHDDAKDIAEKVGLPAIVKPLSGTASSLVRRVDSVEELAAAYSELSTALPGLLGDMYAQQVIDPDTGDTIDQSRTVLVEQLLSGPEVTTDSVIRSGRIEHLLMLENALPDAAFFERALMLPPPRLPTDRQQAVWRAVDDTIDALGLDNMPAHIEVIDDELRGPTVVEVNAGRSGGLAIGVLVRAHLGIDLREEYLSLALGEPSPPRHGQHMPAPLANLAFYPPLDGTLNALDGLDDVAAHPDVIMVQPPPLGRPVSARYESSPVIAIVFGIATVDELTDVYDEIAGMLTWHMEPPG